MMITVRALSLFALASVALALIRPPTDFGVNATAVVVTRDSESPQVSGSDSDYNGEGDNNVDGDNNGDRDRNGTETSRYPNTWVAKLFYETLVDFTVLEDVGSSACQRQTQMYIRHLANDSLWAVQMSDSWSRYPNGILVGTTHQMGVYEECVEVHRPVQGKYCIPNVKLSTTTGEDFRVGKPDEPQSHDHAWREIIGFVDDDKRAPRNQVNFGVCIPDSCTAADLEISLQKEFDKRFLHHQIKAQVQVDSILCSTDKNLYPYDLGFYLTSALFGFIILICVLTTAYHLIVMIRSSNGKKTWKMPEILRVFSIIQNGRDLIKYNKDNDLNIFNGLKVVTMVLVLFGHKFLYFIINPIMYMKRLEMIYTTGPDFLLTCMNLVDPFFYIAGYLMYVMMIPQFSKPRTNWFQIPMVIVYKYLRIIPSYGVMMLLTAFVIPHLGNGPFWASRMWPEADKCKNYWWANLLAASNFIEVDNQCLIAGWYISCLLQFLVIGTILVYIRVKNRKLSIYLISLLFVVSLIIPFVMTYYNRAYGIIKLTQTFLKSPSNSYEFSHLYRPFYLRGIPFYAGLLAGFVVEELKKREIKFSPISVYVGTPVISAICFWVQLYGATFYSNHHTYNVIEQSLYATLSHCTWTTILFWITMCHFTSGYGPIEKLFNNRLMVPLGRLSFAVYLVNITVMMMIESRQRATISPSYEFLVDGWIFGAFRTYMVGTLLYIIIEAPFGLLIKKLLYGMSNRTNDHQTNWGNTNATAETEPKDSTHL